MKKSRRGLLAPLAAAALALAMISFPGCSNQTAAEVFVSLTSAPGTMTINQSVSLTASVGNDPSAAGVDWSCSGAACGAFSLPHTSSGVATVFTAPASPGTITVTATATADATAKASLAISIVPIGSNAMLTGRYVFSVQGVDGAGAYAAVGVIVADGDGHITAGEQDYANESLQAGPDPLTGTYAIGPDGRGSITLAVDNPNLPLSGVETFSVALTSATHALIIQFDGSANSSGSLDSQAASALDPGAVAGAFAFTSQGVQILDQVPITLGGVLTMSASSGAVTSGSYYENDGGVTFQSATTGSITTPDAFGRGTLVLSVGVDFAYYAVQGQALRIIQTDVPSFMTGGSMFGQGAAGLTATFSNASLTGSYAFSHAGGTAFGPLAMAGQFSADGAGGFSAGTSDLNNSGVVSFASLAGPSRYAIAGNGVGTLSLPPIVDQRGSVADLLIFAVAPDLNLFDPNSAVGGGGALIMDFDPGAVASGYIVPQSAGVFDGNYAVNLQFVDSAGETDFVGQSVASAGALTGTVDLNEGGLTLGGLALTGTFMADAVNVGRWSGTFSVNARTHQIVYYQVSGTIFIIVDVDGADVGIGIMEKE
jgi:hypothetical protein